MLIPDRTKGLAFFVVLFIVFSILFELPQKERLVSGEIHAYEKFKETCKTKGVFRDFYAGGKLGDCSVFDNETNYLKFLQSIQECRINDGIIYRIIHRCEWRERVSPQ